MLCIRVGLGGKKVKEAIEPQNKPQSEFKLAVDSVKYLNHLPSQKHAARPRILPKRLWSSSLPIILPKYPPPLLIPHHRLPINNELNPLATHAISIHNLHMLESLVEQKTALIRKYDLLIVCRRIAEGAVAFGEGHFADGVPVVEVDCAFVFLSGGWGGPVEGTVDLRDVPW